MCFFVNLLKKIESHFFCFPDQMWGEESVVLRNIINANNKPEIKILEIGSWCGCSTLILGAAAKMSRGQVVCVDWWRGADDYNALASKHRDIFKIFWKRIVGAGLQDVVIPIRGKSEYVLPLLRAGQFDFIFLDGDHRYCGIKHDIQQSKRLVKNGGLICGHDCECKPTPELLPILEAHKNEDYVRGLHCGVILAVSEEFKKYELENIFWKVKYEND